MSSIDVLSLWDSALLSEIAEISPSRIQPADVSGQFDFVPMQSVGEEFSGIKLSQKRTYREVSKGYTQFLSDDILFAKITPCMENGKLAIVPELSSECGYGSTEYHVIRAHSNVSNKLVAYYLTQHSVRRDAQRNMAGSAGQLRVPTRWLAQLQLPLAPASQQRRIVSKIDELFSDLDAGVAALVRAKAKLKRYRASVLKAAVEGRLTAEWRKANPPKETGEQLLARILAERRSKWEAAQVAKYKAKGQTPPKGWREKYAEPVKPDLSGLPELPEGWCWATVDQVCEIQRYGTSSKTSSVTQGVPVLRMGNIVDGKIIYSNLKFLPSDHAEFPALFLEKGDMLFNRTNSMELVGKTSVYNGDISPCSYASYLIMVRFISGCIPHFVSSVINSNYGKVWISSVVSQQVGQANVNGSKLSSFCFPFPPFVEQQNIVDAINDCMSISEKCLESISNDLIRASRLRQSILKRAFEGKLVPQDPSDEPASVLLERIKAERANATAPASRRGRGRVPKAAAAEATSTAPKRRGRPPKRKE